jgi:transposase
MDENARPHHSRAVTAYLQSEAVTSVPWPAMSPDLNPIEHILDMLSRRTHAREPPVQNKGQNSVNIIGKSTPHFPPFFFDPTCMWQQRQSKMGTSEEI